MAPPRAVFDSEPEPPPPPPPPRPAAIGSSSTRRTDMTPSTTTKRPRGRVNSTPPPSSPRDSARPRSSSTPPSPVKGTASPAKRSASPPPKRHRERPKSTPPPNPRDRPKSARPRDRSSSSPPSPMREGEVLEHRRHPIKLKLEFSPDCIKEKDCVPVVGIFWDLENCPVPKEIESIYENVKRGLSVHKGLNGDIKKFCAYADFTNYPNKMKKRLKSVGIDIEQVSHHDKKEAADKVIISDLLVFGVDHPAPAAIVLFSGDADFARSLRKLGQRGYTIGLGIPSEKFFSSELTSVADYVWHWPSLATGKGAAAIKSLACPQALKLEIAQLLKLAPFGSLAFIDIPEEYHNQFSKPLVIAHHGYNKLQDFFKEFGQDEFIVYGGGRAGKWVGLSADQEEQVQQTDQHNQSTKEQVKDQEEQVQQADLHNQSTEVQDQEDQSTRGIAVPEALLDESIVKMKKLYDVADKEDTEIEVSQTVPNTEARIQAPTIQRQRPRRRVTLD